VTVPPADLECRALVKRFGGHLAVDEESFAIPRGSFFSILGPSGCGKTTLLRMLAGFARPDSGDILIKGASVLDTPPNRRPVNLVFQHLALFPMMSVFENIAFGLRRRRRPESEIRAAVARMLERVGLPEAGPKRIDQLSGGQKQRIAIARCMVLDPAVLLLDEPLGALDLKLREHMKIELKRLQHEFGTTFVYITHDQSEAMMMSDQVAVMNEGRFEQVGAPAGLYHAPVTAFVAGFVGDANRLAARVVAADPAGCKLVTDRGLNLRTGPATGGVPAAGARVEVFLRPEAIAVGPAADGDMNRVEATVEDMLFNGAQSRILAQLPGGETLEALLPQTPGTQPVLRGGTVVLGFAPASARVFPA
jgi:spermidine/putrescine transport system ATP-binding protein